MIKEWLKDRVEMKIGSIFNVETLPNRIFVTFHGSSLDDYDDTCQGCAGQHNDFVCSQLPNCELATKIFVETDIGGERIYGLESSGKRCDRCSVKWDRTGDIEQYEVDFVSDETVFAYLCDDCAEVVIKND